MTPIEYKGITLNFEQKQHGKKEQKISVEFSLNGSGYTNATLLSKHATDEQVAAAVAELTKWAETIINDHQK